MKLTMLLCNLKKPLAAQRLETPGKKLCIKLQITSKAAITTSDVAHKMTQALRSIQDEFGNIIIIKNNKNNTLQQFKFDEPEDFANDQLVCLVVWQLLLSKTDDD
jgi:hypothetical protein